MKKTPIVAVAVAAALGGARGDEGTVRNGNGVLTIRVIGAAAPSPSSRILEVGHRNASTETAVVYGDLSRGVDLEIRSDAGELVVPPVLWHTICPPPRPKPTDYVVLQPGHALSWLDTRSLKELGVSRPGRYAVVAAYWHLIREDKDGLRLSLRREPIRSQAVAIDVVPEI